jgi:hypothetical protein
LWNRVPLKTPKCYGVIRDADYNNIGILMENLLTNGCALNLDLNREKVEVSFQVIKSIAKMHSAFWDKPISKIYKELKKNDNEMFKPSWREFVCERWSAFKDKWASILSESQLEIGDNIVVGFQRIQDALSERPLTLCHGDVKSANIFYRPLPNGGGDGVYEPYLDWQYLSHGKGVQDLVFFMIESFDADTIVVYRTLFKEYYYVKLMEFGVEGYTRAQYERDYWNAARYFPFFVAVWFGTINSDELIDKNFPFFYIQRLFHFYTLETGMTQELG